MSELADRMQADLVAAMKARDDLVRSTLRMAMTAIKNEEVAGTEARELSDNEVLGVLNREVAKRRDSAEAYTAGNRPELAEKELAEVEVLQRYLPAALTDAELDAIVAEEVAAAAAQAGEALTMRQMGLVIKAVNARAAGRAEGAKVAAKVKAALS
ncbi:MAG: GatB/YqeY domain-containing protein [Propionicimonas sp.]